ncbi:MAG: response regulator, partial [Deltaproteobacteria bacterium]|nr:response regulator [Deltaproteobacteria bacterium]
MSAEKILIVDDEAGMQRLLARVLERQGYETITVGSAREALQIIEADPVDLVLTDIKMPG